jgi:hypothetical protein
MSLPDAGNLRRKVPLLHQCIPLKLLSNGSQDPEVQNPEPIGDNMKTLNQAQVKQVAGGAIDPVMGLFPKTGIKLIDSIHAGEWKSYGRPLYNAFAAVLGAPKAP